MQLKLFRMYVPGKVMHVRYKTHWFRAQFIETEVYYIHKKASHTLSGSTKKRKKRKILSMPAGTIYIYYARGGYALNVCVAVEKGTQVLIKLAVPYITMGNPTQMIAIMQRLNSKNNTSLRNPEKLYSGQTLLCNSLNLHVNEWNQKTFSRQRFFIKNNELSSCEDYKGAPRRPGMPEGR